MKKSIVALLTSVLIVQSITITSMATDGVNEENVDGSVVTSTEEATAGECQKSETEINENIISHASQLLSDDSTIKLQQETVVQSETIEDGSQGSQVMTAQLKSMPGDIGASEAEWEVLRLINIERAKAGLDPLFMREDLQDAANVRAVEAAQSFSMTRPNGKEWDSIFVDKNIEATWVAEVLLRNTYTVQDVVDTLMSDSNKNQDILNPDLSYIGIAYNNGVWAQEYIEDNYLHRSYTVNYESTPILVTNNPDDIYYTFFRGVLSNGKFTFSPIDKDVFKWTPYSGGGSQLKITNNDKEIFTLYTMIDPNLSKMSNLKANGEGDGKVRLTWSESDSVTGYLVYAQKDGKYGYAGMTTASTQFLDTKALVDEYNFYWVFPYVKGTDGVIYTGNPAKYVYAKGNCAAVTNLKASSVKDGVKLSWNKSVGADGYLIYGIRPGERYSYVGMTTTGIAFTDTKASKTQYNYYWVYPYHKDSKDNMVIGGVAKYTYGRAL